MVDILGNIELKETQNKIFKKIFNGFEFINSDNQKKAILSGYSHLREEIVFDKEISLK
jgi:hypothetical protein